VPVPGTLIVAGAERGVRLQLNGSSYYTTGGRNPQYLRMPAGASEPLRLELAPGPFVLTASGSGDATTALSVQVVSGGIDYVEVEYDRERQVIRAAVRAGG
jgi:hypothetical protein